MQQNTLATFNVLEATRANGIKTIAFSSTGSVYGEADVIPTPEEAPFLIQTSLYGASKVAGEGLIQAYCEGYGFEGYIFRFVSILGERYTHGHVFDISTSNSLSIPSFLKCCRGGTQRKSYLHIADCLDAMLHAIKIGAARNAKHRVEVYNLGTQEYCRVTDSIGWICEYLGLNPRLEFSGGDPGWVGDNPFIFLETQKIQKTGRRARLTIREGILRTIDWLRENPWVLGKR